MDDMDLFSAAAAQTASGYEPLAQRMRPRNFAEFIGQEDVVGEGKYLRQIRKTMGPFCRCPRRVIQQYLETQHTRKFCDPSSHIAHPNDTHSHAGKASALFPGPTRQGCKNILHNGSRIAPWRIGHFYSVRSTIPGIYMIRPNGSRTDK